MAALITAALLGGCAVLGGAGTLATYWEHRRYVTRAHFSSPFQLDEVFEPGRHRRREGGPVEPGVFEIAQPDRPGNSGAGYEDPEYAAMKAGRELAHYERSRGGRAPQDYVWLKAYTSHRYGSRRFGLITYIDAEHVVRSFASEDEAMVEYMTAWTQLFG